MTENERALKDCKDMLDDIYEVVQNHQERLLEYVMKPNQFESTLIIFMHKWDALKAEYGL